MPRLSVGGTESPGMRLVWNPRPLFLVRRSRSRLRKVMNINGHLHVTVMEVFTLTKL